MIIGLTGGIGSGKSTIARIFEMLGVKVYYADERAKASYFLSHVKPKIEILLGKESYINGSILNKKYIAQKIFSDDELLKKLNEIIHAEVKNDFYLFAEKYKKEKYIIKESALLVEANLLSTINKLLLVTSDIKLREERIIKRDGLTKEEINKRIEKQLPDAEKIKHADWIIDNNEQELLIPHIIEIHKSLVG